jgi:hypothetical protein
MAQKQSKLVKDLHRNIHTKFHSNPFSGSQEEDSWNIPLYIDLIQYGEDVMLFEILLGFSWTQNYLKSEFRRNIKER